MLLSIGNHALDILISQTTLVGLDLSVGGSTSDLVSGTDVEDTVGIQLESNLDLGLSLAGSLDTGNFELSQLVVGSGNGTLTLEDNNINLGLVVIASGVFSAHGARNGGVSGDKHRHHSALKLNSEGKRGNIEEDQVGDNTGKVSTSAGTTGLEDGSLHGSSESNSLIGVHRLAKLDAVIEVRDQGILDGRNTGGSSDKDDISDGISLDIGILQHLTDSVHASLEETERQLVEDSSSKGGRKSLTGSDKGIDLNVALISVRDGTLGSLASTTQTLHGANGSLDGSGGSLSVLLLDLRNAPVDQARVEVLSSEVSITTGGLDSEHTTLHGEHRHIEGTTTKIEDHDIGLIVGRTISIGRVESVGKGGSSGLVDDTNNVKSGNTASILGSLSLLIIEMGRDSDDGLGAVASEEGISRSLHLEQNHGGDLLGGHAMMLTSPLKGDNGAAITGISHGKGESLHLVTKDMVLHVAANDTLNIVDGVGSVHGSLLLGGVSHNTASLGKGNPRRGGQLTNRVGDDNNLLLGSIVSGNARVSGSKINPDNGSFRFSEGSHFIYIYFSSK
jgi:hypothetical protein